MSESVACRDCRHYRGVNHLGRFWQDRCVSKKARVAQYHRSIDIHMEYWDNMSRIGISGRGPAPDREPIETQISSITGKPKMCYGWADCKFINGDKDCEFFELSSLDKFWNWVWEIKDNT